MLIARCIRLCFQEPRDFHDRAEAATRHTFKDLTHVGGLRAEIEILTPHEAGRHGFYTELTVRRGLDRRTAAEAGRWADPVLSDRIYARSELPDAGVRQQIRTKPVQTS